MQGVAITFAVVAGGGSVPAPAAVTGPDGAAVTDWVLGPTQVPQVLEARADGMSPVRATAAVADCAPAACPVPDPPVLDALELLALETYDRSGQVVHPDVAPSATIGAYPFWLAITPYPGGDPHFENPSVFQSANGRLWQVPAGLTNPAFLPRTGYLSDPDVLFDAVEGRLWMYYRQVVGDAERDPAVPERGRRRVERAGGDPAGPQPRDRVAGGRRGSPVAPWTMFSVNSGPDGCTAHATTVELRTSDDGRHWSAPVAPTSRSRDRWRGTSTSSGFRPAASTGRSTTRIRRAARAPPTLSASPAVPTDCTGPPHPRPCCDAASATRSATWSTARRSSSTRRAPT